MTNYPSLNLEIIITGPKDSSLATNMSSVTSVNIVGYIKNPAPQYTTCYYTRRNQRFINLKVELIKYLVIDYISFTFADKRTARVLFTT